MISVPINERQFDQLINGLSQLPAYTIGRSLDNQIVIFNSKVSGHHAQLIHCTPASFVLNDLDSKNGSFVNGVRITRKVVDKQDTLRFADTELTVDQLLALLKVDTKKPAVTPPPTPAVPKFPPKVDADSLDFTQAFADLKQVHDQYPKLRKDCRNREKMIRTGSVILSSIIGISAVLTTGGGALPFMQLMSGAGLSMLIPTLCSTILSTDEKLEIIDKEYREKYRCPNPACRDQFIPREWEQLALQKTCRRCQAIWVR